MDNVGNIVSQLMNENPQIRKAKELFQEYKTLVEYSQERGAIGGLNWIDNVGIGNKKKKLEKILSEILTTPGGAQPTPGQAATTPSQTPQQNTSSNYTFRSATLIKGAKALLEDRYDGNNGAIILLNSLTQGAPVMPEASTLLGIAHYRKGNLNEAISILEQATAQFPGEIKNYNTLGEVKQRNRDVDGAIEAHKKAYDIDSSNKDANTELARLYREKAATLQTEVLNETGVNATALQNFKDAIKAYVNQNYVKVRELAEQVAATLATPVNDNEKLVKARALHYLACASTTYKDAIDALRQSLTAKATKEAYIAIAEKHEALLK